MLQKVRLYLTSIERRTWFHFAVAAITLLAAWPLFGENMLLNTRGGGDSPFLLQRVQQLVVALSDGHFPVRWMPDAAYGYGYPFFNYYAPLSIYVAAFFRFLGFSFVRAIQLAQFAGFLLAAWATFQLAVRWFHDEWVALLSAAAYTLAPFHLVNVYVRGDSLAEFWAMALYPVVLLAVDSAVLLHQEESTSRLRRFLSLAFLGVSYGALVLCHNISALIFSPFVLLYVLLLSWQRQDRRLRLHALLYGAAGLLMGLALSAWFWLPALGESDLVQTGPVTEGYFHFSNHFLGRDLVQPSLLFSYDVVDRAAFRMGLLQTLLAVAGGGALLWQVARGRIESRFRLRAFFMLALLLLATFMMTPLSAPLWEALPLLPFVQFPWRFLSIQALGASLVTGALATLPWRRLLVPALAALLLAAALGDLSPDYLFLSDEDVTSERLAQYEWFTGNIGTTVSAEYLPQSVQPRPYTSPWLERGQRDWVQVLDGEAQVQLQERRTASQQWQVSVAEPATLEFPTLYWLGWRALLDGEEVSLTPSGNSGLITVRLPAGQHELRLYLARTPLRAVAEGVSLWALLLVLALIAAAVVRAAERQRLPIRRRYLAWTTIGLLALLLLRLWPQQGVRAAQALTWDFAQMGYLSRAPGGVLFEDGARLLSYSYSDDVVKAGESVQITVRWSETPAVPDAVLSLETPAAHRFASAAPLQVAQQPASAGTVSYELPIPDNAAGGLYVPRLERNASQALTFPGRQTRGDLFLRPLRVVSVTAAGEAEQRLQLRVDDVSLLGAAPAAGEAAGLYDCAATTPSPGQLLLELAWFTPSALPDNYTASLRLTGPSGLLYAQCDLQPGYGFNPSGSWPARQWVPDRLTLPLPPQLPAGESYILALTLYEQPGQAILTRRLGEVTFANETLAFQPVEPSFQLPASARPVTARFGDSFLLRGYELSQEGQTLSLTLYWESLAPVAEDYVRFAHLVGEPGQPPVAQVDGMPAANTYPTSQWSLGEIVTDHIVLNLEEVPPGSYRLAVGFYPSTDPAARLPASGQDGQPLPDNRFLLPASVEK